MELRIGLAGLQDKMLLARTHWSDLSISTVNDSRRGHVVFTKFKSAAVRLGLITITPGFHLSRSRIVKDRSVEPCFAIVDRGSRPGTLET